MLDIYTIKKYIIENPENIELLLEKSGFSKIQNKKNEFRCAFDSNTNATSIKVSKENLYTVDFSRGTKGDIITIIQSKTNKSFRDTLDYICETIGLRNIDIQKKDITLPFGGYYKKITTNKMNNIEHKIYSEEILEDYLFIPNKMFYDDGILSHTQEKYEVGYDVVTGRVIVVWRDTKGSIVGIMGRYNSHEILEGFSKWFPIISFPKSNYLYGYDKNYNNIHKKKIVILGESEKFPQQLDSMGIEIGMSVGGSFISQNQVNNINALTPDTLILAFDEGLSEELIINNAKLLKMDNIFMKNNVGYIYDKNNLYLPKGCKSSPTDFGKETFKQLMKNCVIWV